MKALLLRLSLIASTLALSSCVVTETTVYTPAYTPAFSVPGYASPNYIATTPVTLYSPDLYNGYEGLSYDTTWYGPTANYRDSRIYLSYW